MTVFYIKATVGRIANPPYTDILVERVSNSLYIMAEGWLVKQGQTAA